MGLNFTFYIEFSKEKSDRVLRKKNLDPKVVFRLGFDFYMLFNMQKQDRAPKHKFYASVLFRNMINLGGGG